MSLSLNKIKNNKNVNKTFYLEENIMKNVKFYICEKCGNIVQKIEDSGVSVVLLDKIYELGGLSPLKDCQALRGRDTLSLLQYAWLTPVLSQCLGKV